MGGETEAPLLGRSQSAVGPARRRPVLAAALGDRAPPPRPLLLACIALAILEPTCSLVGGGASARALARTRRALAAPPALPVVACVLCARTTAPDALPACLPVAAACLSVALWAGSSRRGGAIEAEAMPVRQAMMQRQRRAIGMPRGQMLDIDFLPIAYDASFGTEPESYDAPEFQVGFNGADADGASWRQYVPVAVWSDQDWFDDAG